MLATTVLLLRPHQEARTSVLMVDLQPPAIRLDGKVIGRTPFRVPGLASQTVEIEVRKEGYRVFHATRGLEPGRTTQIEAGLIPESN